MELERRIRLGEAQIVVVGLGYVGLPIATELARSGLRVVGLDRDRGLIDVLNDGRSHIPDVPDDQLKEASKDNCFRATADYSVVRDADVIFICVPTPCTENKSPDLSAVIAAAEGIAECLRVGHLVVLQSTTYPGTTEEVVLPILERSGLRAGRDFHLAFSPERVNPGDRIFGVHNTPKVVGGLTPRCGELTKMVLERLSAEVKLVSTPRAAEMTKLLENIYRSVNIALVNEIAQLSERMGIDFWEVINAAATKPFGFMPFYPGPGVGGHCIPVDPYFLSWKAREYDFQTKFIELAAEVNQSMPAHACELVGRALNERGQALKGARVLVLGVAFKPDIKDARNSPAARLIELLLNQGALVRYHDPYVPTFAVGGNPFRKELARLASVLLMDEELTSADVVVIVTPHSVLDMSRVVRLAKLVVDTRNATAGIPEREGKVALLGAPWPYRDKL